MHRDIKPANLLLTGTEPPQVKVANVGLAKAFEREAETWVNLELHPHIVTCYYVRRIDGLPAVFAEPVDGGSLKEAIANGSVRSLEQTLGLAIQIAWGLDAAHTAHLVHRDVKPANVMLSADGVAKVTDFGLAVARPRAVAGSGDHSIPVPGGGGGTPAYCSPEQAAGTPLGRRTDIYSWAACVVEMLRGERTWEYGPAVGEALADMHAQSSFAVEAPPERLVSLLGSCLAVDATERPADLATVAEQLAEVYEQATGARYGRARPKVGRRRADTLNNRAVSLIDLGRGGDAEATIALIALAVAREDDPGAVASAEQRLAEMSTQQRRDPRLAAACRALASLRSATGIDRAAAATTGLTTTRRVLATGATLSAVTTTLSYVAAASGNRLVCWRHEAPDQRRNLGEIGERVRNLAGIEDDTVLVASDGAPLLRLDLSTGRTQPAAPHLPGYVMSIATTANGERVVAGSSDRHLRVIDTTSARCLFEIEAHHDRLAAVAIARDGRLGVIGGRDARLCTWDLETGSCLREIDTDGVPVDVLAVSRSGELVATAGADGTVRLWATRTGESAGRLAGHGSQVLDLAIDGEHFLISAGLDRRVRAWDLTAGRVHAVWIGDEPVRSVSTHANEVIAAADGVISLWEPHTRRRVRRMQGHRDTVTALQTTPDCRFLISSSRDGTVRTWNLRTGTCVHTLTAYPAGAVDAALERAVTCLMQVRDPAIVGEIVQLVMEWTEAPARTPRSVPTTISDLAGICAARHTAAIPELAPLVTDERRPVRILAISALAMIAHERAGETLRTALTSPDSEIRGDAARHLRTAIGTDALEPADGLDVVLRLLEDPEPATRRWAVQALPLFSEPEALAAARAATTDEDEGVAHAAEQALRRLEENERLTWQLDR